jgi:ribosomal protein S6--L-glutamate ligase
VEIERHFAYPFINKTLRGLGPGPAWVFLIQGSEDLARSTWATRATPQPTSRSKLPIDRDVRVVMIGFELICVYWRVPPAGDFRSDVA